MKREYKFISLFTVGFVLTLLTLTFTNYFLKIGDNPNNYNYYLINGLGHLLYFITILIGISFVMFGMVESIINFLIEKDKKNANIMIVLLVLGIVIILTTLITCLLLFLI